MSTINVPISSDTARLLTEISRQVEREHYAGLNTRGFLLIHYALNQLLANVDVGFVTIPTVLADNLVLSLNGFLTQLYPFPAGTEVPQVRPPTLNLPPMVQDSNIVLAVDLGPRVVRLAKNILNGPLASPFPGSPNWLNACKYACGQLVASYGVFTIVQDLAILMITSLELFTTTLPPQPPKTSPPTVPMPNNPINISQRPFLGVNGVIPLGVFIPLAPLFPVPSTDPSTFPVRWVLSQYQDVLHEQLLQAQAAHEKWENTIDPVDKAYWWQVYLDREYALKNTNNYVLQSGAYKWVNGRTIRQPPPPDNNNQYKKSNPQIKITPDKIEIGFWPDSEAIKDSETINVQPNSLVPPGEQFPHPTLPANFAYTTIAHRVKLIKEMKSFMNGLILLPSYASEMTKLLTMLENSV